jgi:hypothetical protein
VAVPQLPIFPLVGLLDVSAEQLAGGEVAVEVVAEQSPALQFV